MPQHPKDERERFRRIAERLAAIRRGDHTDEYAPEPDREHRPSLEELRGISEYEVQAAAGPDAGEDAEVPIQPDPELPELDEPSLTQGPMSDGIPEDDTIEADELGSAFLRGAVQDQRATGDDAADDIDETAKLGTGERRMLDGRLGRAETEGPVVTNLPARADVEQELSQLSEAAVHDVVRDPAQHQRAGHIRRQSEIAAARRADQKSEYLGRVKKRRAPRRGA